MTLNLDIEGINCAAPAIPNFVMECSTFKISKSDGSRADQGPVARYTMGATNFFDCAIFKYPYTTLADYRDLKIEQNSELYSKIRQFWVKVKELTLLELMKLPEDQRPPVQIYDRTIQHVIDYRHIDFQWDEDQVPETWSYYDDELLARLDKLWKEHERSVGQGYNRRKNGKGKN
jgi:hypothetical protein